MLQRRLKDVRERMAQAAQRGRRPITSVTLIAVTKTVPAAMVQEVAHLGVIDVGENRVQEAQHKQGALGSQGLRSGSASPDRIRWHLIGHLQRNKARLAIELFDVVHSVDSRALLTALAMHAANQRRSHPLEVLLQVNVSGEKSKFGCSPEALPELIAAVREAQSLTLSGLMTLAPFSDDPEASRSHFRRLRHMRDTLAPGLKLSMGMTQDFEVAIEEGADYIRVGTALFGQKPAAGARGQGPGAREENDGDRS